MEVSKLKVSVLCLTFFVSMINGQSYNYTEKYRLQLHYSPPNLWSNDPNGLIYDNGIYHLYYQCNPHAGQLYIANTSWGHAISTDLIHWTNKPIAIQPKSDLVKIFSGCALIDKNNFTGIATSKCKAPLLAIYTQNNGIPDADFYQDQRIAYSLDNGITFSIYGGNPVLPNQGNPDFRDPFITKRNGIFYMFLAVGYKIQIFKSSNLLSWSLSSEFGVNPMQGDKTKGVWECPALYSLTDQYGMKHDVIIFSTTEPVHKTIFNVTQYSVGKFKNGKFISYIPQLVLYLDNGYDNYAGVPYNNEPKGREIFLGWMNNWVYALNIPTSTWRGQYTIPRVLGLKNLNGILRLTQRPVEEFFNLIDRSRTFSLNKFVQKLRANRIVHLTRNIPFKMHSMFSLNYTFDLSNVCGGKIGFKFGNDLGEFVSFVYDIDTRLYVLNRKMSGNTTFHPRFAADEAISGRISYNNMLNGQIILDVAAIEIYADNGLNTFTALFFPSKIYENIELVYNTNQSKCDKSTSVKVQDLHIAALNSIWNQPKNCQKCSKNKY